MQKNLILTTLMIFTVFACSSNSNTGGGTDTGTGTGTNAYAISGTVSGLSGTLVLQNNGSDDLTITADGTFSFATKLADSAAYSITVLTQPTSPNQICSVASGSGTVSSADVTNISVVCATNTYTIGGNVSGLAGTGLVLQNNTGDNLTITADGAFTFAAAIADSAAYSITVLTQPTSPNQMCTVSSGAGTVCGANVTSVSIVCSSVFDNGDGTIVNSNTTLIWKKCSQGQNNDATCSGTAVTYQYCNSNDHTCDSGSGGILNGTGTSSAWATCNGLNSSGGFAGRTDWRVPTKDELKTIVYCSNGPAAPLPDITACNGGYTSPTIDTTLFPNTVAGSYWSSSTYVGSITTAWNVYFTNGSSNYTIKTSNGYVRCVTTGP